MPLREIVWRLRYEARTRIERAMHRRGRLASPDRLRRALIPDLRSRDDWPADFTRRERAGVFFSAFDDVLTTRARFAAEYGDEQLKARGIAGAVARHEIEFFGERFRYGKRIDWHADPVSRAKWPAI